MMDSCLFPEMQIFPLKASITQSKTSAVHAGGTNTDCLFNTDTRYILIHECMNQWRLYY